MTPPCGVPESGYVTSPSSITPACSHLPIRRSSTPSCTRLRRIVRSCPWSSVSKKAPDVHFEHPAPSHRHHPFAEHLQRLVGRPTRSKPVRAVEKILLVDG